MKNCFKELLLSGTFATVLTVLVWRLAGRPSADGPNLFGVCVFPFYMIGVLFSGNAHQPSELAAYGSTFVFFFGLTFGLSQIIVSAARRRAAAHTIATNDSK